MATVANCLEGSVSTKASNADRGCPRHADCSAGAVGGSGLNHLTGLS